MTKSELETLAQQLTDDNDTLKAEIADLKKQLESAVSKPVQRKAILVPAV